MDEELGRYFALISKRKSYRSSSKLFGPYERMKKFVVVRSKDLRVISDYVNSAYDTNTTIPNESILSVVKNKGSKYSTRCMLPGK